MELPIEVCEMHRWACEDFSRANIYHRVRIERSGAAENKLVAVATDGKTLTTFEWVATPDAIAEVGNGVHLNSEALESLRKVARKAKLATIALGRWMCTVGEMIFTLQEREDLHSFKFPDWRQVTAQSNSDDLATTFGIETENFARAYDTLRACKAHTNATMRAASSAGLGPMVLETSIGFRFVFMPVQL